MSRPNHRPNGSDGIKPCRFSLESLRVSLGISCTCYAGSGYYAYLTHPRRVAVEHRILRIHHAYPNRRSNGSG